MACGKVCYTSKHHARVANGRNGKTLRVYQCFECNGAWHVTKSRGKWSPEQ